MATATLDAASVLIAERCSNMTSEQIATLDAMAKDARPINDDDWGSERQINASNAFHIYASADLGIDTEDMATAKATCEEMIDETLRRARMIHLCEEYQAWLKAHNLPAMSADELLVEIQWSDNPNKAHMDWLMGFIARWDAWTKWREWHPEPVGE